jgi:chemotaxis family two-component system response regulator Rcp1
MEKNEFNSHPVEILLVEDNPGDSRLAKEALKESKLLNNPRPDLIILDLNLPKKDGREVLAEIKNDEDLKRIPVVILTISKAEEDILRTYNLHANCYVTKPLDLDQFMKVVKSIEDFWLTIVKLPNGKE